MVPKLFKAQSMSGVVNAEEAKDYGQKVRANIQHNNMIQAKGVRENDKRIRMMRWKKCMEVCMVIE